MRRAVAVCAFVLKMILVVAAELGELTATPIKKHMSDCHTLRVVFVCLSKGVAQDACTRLSLRRPERITLCLRVLVKSLDVDAA